MFPHKEHLDLTLASLLASSSPSVPPSAGVRSFGARSITPAKESRERPFPGASSTAGFGSGHKVFKSCWQLPASLQHRAASPPSCPPFAAASGHFHHHPATVTSSWGHQRVRARSRLCQHNHCSVSGGLLLPCLRQDSAGVLNHQVIYLNRSDPDRHTQTALPEAAGCRGKAFFGVTYTC